jgi:hypothetical protein
MSNWLGSHTFTCLRFVYANVRLHTSSQETFCDGDHMSDFDRRGTLLFVVGAMNVGIAFILSKTVSCLTRRRDLSFCSYWGAIWYRLGLLQGLAAWGAH